MSGPYAVWDSEDHTFHCGEGEWRLDPRRAESYSSKAKAMQAIRDCDNGRLFRHRFHIVPFGVGRIFLPRVGGAR